MNCRPSEMIAQNQGLSWDRTPPVRLCGASLPATEDPAGARPSGRTVVPTWPSRENTTEGKID